MFTIACCLKRRSLCLSKQDLRWEKKVVGALPASNLQMAAGHPKRAAVENIKAVVWSFFHCANNKIFHPFMPKNQNESFFQRANIVPYCGGNSVITMDESKMAKLQGL